MWSILVLLYEDLFFITLITDNLLEGNMLLRVTVKVDKC